MFLLLFALRLLGESNADMFSRQPSPNIEAVFICSLFPDFTPHQTRLCIDNPQVVAAISKGVNTGLKECEYQFRNHRWNCSSTKDKSSFGQTRAVPGTKEASFTSAIVAAGVAYAVTRECAKGNISSCSCDKRNDGKTTQGRWKWGGCSDDIDYGIKISNKFLDASSESSDKRYELQNKHNSNTGRKVLKESAVKRCICHGSTGTCSMKTCWQVLPQFRSTGYRLYSMHGQAVRVKADNVSSRLGYRLIIKKPPEDCLIYFDKSSTYCDKNPKLGIFGVEGRVCKQNSVENSVDNCASLCCGRGYNEQIIETVNPCYCLFKWCCSVDCKSCKANVSVLRCK